MPGVFHRYTNSISFRITFWLTLVICAIVSFHIYLVSPEKRFYEQKSLESERLARVIESHLVTEMMSGALDNVQIHLERLSGESGIHRVEIISASDSKVHFSTESSRRGKVVDRMSDDPCVRCHALAGGPPPRLVFNETGVGRIFAVDHLLLNRKECAGCHADDGPVIGNLLVEISLTDVDYAMLRADRRLMVSGGALLLVLLVGVAYTVHHFVGRPVARLVGKMNRIESGDLAVEIPISADNEFRYLEVAFRNMVGKLREVYAGMERTIRSRTHSLYETQAQVIHQEKLVGIGQLAAGVAHEIGNPLTAIDSLAQLIAVETDDPKVLEKVETIQGQVSRISEIVHGMADLSRPLSLEKRPVSVNRVLRSMLGLARYDARFKPIEVRTDLDEKLPVVETVEDRLFCVFLNLALNAADAMPDGGVLDIRTTAEADAIVVLFRDSGVGIPPENLKKIFDPFFTTKEPGRGTGLGLSVCRTALRDIGGDVEVESIHGEGATFRVIIPQVERAAEEGKARGERHG